MKYNDILASTIPQYMVDKVKRMFLSGCYFTIEEIEASIGRGCAVDIILLLKQNGINIRNLMLPDGRIIYGLDIDETSEDGNTQRIGEILRIHSENRESLMFHIQNRKGGRNG